jgi:hypothetical protein
MSDADLESTIDEIMTEVGFQQMVCDENPTGRLTFSAAELHTCWSVEEVDKWLTTTK